MDEIIIKPIGVFHCEQSQPVDSPRQGVLAEESCGVVSLSDELPLECLQDLAGFSHIWLIYQFHHNKDWKPMVRPPRNSEKKRGVLATRSPYRPNGIGTSCVKLEKIEGRRVFCRKHDLLDGTPILDIKPYLAYSDSFPEAKKGWINDSEKFLIEMTPFYLKKVKWLEEQSGKSFHSVVQNQLSFEPTNKKIKRVEKLGEKFCFSYRTWRVHFAINGDSVILLDILSGYSPQEIRDNNDLYKDKTLHRKFLEKFLN